MHTLLQDLRYAFRQLRKNPGFALTAVLTLALGVGATTAVFSVAYGVLIDPFPYQNTKQLATPKLCAPNRPRCNWMVYNPEQFNEIAGKTDIFDGLTGSTISDVTLTGGSEPERLRGNYITPNTFEVLGAKPLIGRATTDADVQPGHGEVALLSYRYWQAHFGGSPSILGRVLVFNRHPRTIIGVMPPRFLWRGGDVYLPINMVNAREVQGQSYFAIVGRLKPGVTDAQASAELKPIFDDFSKTNPRWFPKDLRLGIMPFTEMFQSGLASTLYLLLGSVFVLLLIACVNVSSLLLARAVNREHEFVVRASIGATRWRLVRSALTESMVLAIATMPVALGLAWLGLQATLRIVPAETIPDEAVVTLNIPVLLASIGIALATVILFGMAPAWHSANPRLATALGSGGRTVGSRAQRRLLSGFVVTEIALSLALLMLAGLMVRSLIAAESVPVKFSPDHTLTMRVALASDRYTTADSRISFFRQLLERVNQLPGVKAATVDTAVPVIGGYGTPVQVEGKPPDKRPVDLHLTDPAYLTASGLKMIAGHFIDEREVAVKAHEAVVTQKFAARYFAGENVLGRVVHIRDLPRSVSEPTQAGPANKDDAFTIVGIVEDVPLAAYFTEEFPSIFVPYTVAPYIETLVVSTALPATELATPIRRAIYSIDNQQPIAEVFTLRQLLDMYGYAGTRFALALFGTFAVAALVLSLVGIYGVLSFVTSQRTQEIGIRMALGSGRGRVMWMVLRQACMLAVLGVAVGLPLALFAGRFAKDELVQTSQHDPIALIAAICVLPLLAVAGTLLPARRAAAIDPVKALRAE
jgi:putative ABC transport system permease protein